MPNIKFTYFDLWGRGETTRMLLGISGIKYFDVRVKGDEWKALKPNVPWGTLPVLEVDGRVIGQSKAIHRFAAKLAGLAGKNDIEAAIADSIVDGISDAFDGIVPVVFAPADQQASLASAYKEKTLNPFFEKLEKILIKNGGTGYLAGGDMTWADIHFFVSFKQVMDRLGYDVFKDSFPKLKALYERIQFNTKVRQYVAKNQK